MNVRLRKTIIFSYMLSRMDRKQGKEGEREGKRKGGREADRRGYLGEGTPLRQELGGECNGGEDEQSTLKNQ